MRREHRSSTRAAESLDGCGMPSRGAPLAPADAASDVWERATKLVELWGDDTLACFALRADKEFFFSSDGRAMIAFARYWGTALASGDPIGHPDSLRLVIDEFIEMCQFERLRVAFLGVREDAVALYARHGLEAFYYGDEALVRCGEFSLDGSARRAVRLPVNKLVRHGFTFELIDETACSRTTLRVLEAIRSVHHGKESERGFTMGLDSRVDGTHAGLLLAIARNPEGRVEAFLRIAPCSAGPRLSYSLDLMCRGPDCINGVNEFLIANTALTLRERGVEVLSLNFSVYRRYLGDSPLLDPRLRRNAWVLTRFEWLFPIRPLVHWNAKFAPRWLSRCILHQPGRLLLTLLLYVIAEGFIRLPLIGQLEMPRVRELA